MKRLASLPPSDADVTFISKASQSIVAANDKIGAMDAAVGRINQLIDASGEKEQNLIQAGIEARVVASYSLLTGGLRLLASDVAGWNAVADGCGGYYLQIKTIFDRRSNAKSAPLDLGVWGLGLMGASFCAGSALLFPSIVNRSDVVRWCRLLERDGVQKHTETFVPDVGRELVLQFGLSLAALHVPNDASFERSLNGEMTQHLSRAFDVRSYLVEAIGKHAAYSAQGLKRKYLEFEGFPGFCIFPAHLVAIARKLDGFPANGSDTHSLLSRAHFAPLPERIELQPVLQRLKNDIERSGLFE